VRLGTLLIFSDKVQSEKSLDDELKNLIAQPLRAPKKKKNKAAKTEGEEKKE
jgi:hypothetical protein